MKSGHPDIRCSNPSHLNKRFSSKCSRGSLLQWLHCQLLFSRGVLDILLRMLGLYVISQAGILWVWQFTVITIDTDHVVDGPLVLGNVRLNQGCQIYLRFQNQFSKLFKNAINKKKYHRHLTSFDSEKHYEKNTYFANIFKTPVYTTKLKKKKHEKLCFKTRSGNPCLNGGLVVNRALPILLPLEKCLIGEPFDKS